MNDVIIRPAGPRDLPGIHAIYNDAVLHTTASYDYEPRGFDYRQAWFAEHERDGFPVFVAVNAADEILGWSSLSRFHNRIGYQFTAENSVYVAATYRGRGLGGRLLAPLIQAARERGLHAIIACIDASNEASVRLHARHGFTPAGRLREVGFKFDRWLDVVYMQLML